MYTCSSDFFFHQKFFFVGIVSEGIVFGRVFSRRQQEVMRGSSTSNCNELRQMVLFYFFSYFHFCNWMLFIVEVEENYSKKPVNCLSSRNSS